MQLSWEDTCPLFSWSLCITILLHAELLRMLLKQHLLLSKQRSLLEICVYIDLLNTKVMSITSMFICNICPVLFAHVIFITIEKCYRSMECIFQTPFIPSWAGFCYLERRTLQELQYIYKWLYLQEVLGTEVRQGLSMRYDTKPEMGFQYRLWYQENPSEHSFAKEQKLGCFRTNGLNMKLLKNNDYGKAKLSFLQI